MFWDEFGMQNLSDYSSRVGDFVFSMVKFSTGKIYFFTLSI